MKVIENKEDKKRHICNVCGRQLTQSSDLKRHLRIHSDDLPFSCTVCFRAFRLKSTLRIHFRKHSKYEPYACQFCEKSFKTLSHKMHHQNSHHQGIEIKNEPKLERLK